MRRLAPMVMLVALAAGCSGGSDLLSPGRAKDAAGGGKKAPQPAPSGEGGGPDEDLDIVEGAGILLTARCSADTGSTYVKGDATDVTACLVRTSEGKSVTIASPSVTVHVKDAGDLHPALLPKEVETSPWQVGFKLDAAARKAFVSLEIAFTDTKGKPRVAKTRSLTFDWRTDPAFATGETPPADAPMTLAPEDLAVLNRTFDGADHRLNGSAEPVGQYGYYPDGLMLDVVKAQSARPGMRRLIWCDTTAKPTDTFESVSEDCEGFGTSGATPGVLGYLLADPIPGAAEVIRCLNSATGDRFTTVDPAECAGAGRVRETSLGYAPSTAAASPKPVDFTPPASHVIYRYVNASGLHAFSQKSDGQYIPAGFTLEGPAYVVYTTKGWEEHWLSLTSCYTSANSTFASQRPDCDGLGGSLSLHGFAWKEQKPGTTPLYECFKGADHIQTRSLTECTSNGYQQAGVLGYVPGP